MAGPIQNSHTGLDHSIKRIDLSYDHDNSDETARNLVFVIRPKWRDYMEELDVVKFTDGITNTLLKISRKAPGASQADIDRETVLMRAYGDNTDIIIDRDREAQSHALLAERGMAPPLLARFNNGLLYGYIPGRVTTPEDLAKDAVWRGVAQKLGEWHARVPISALTTDDTPSLTTANGHTNGNHISTDTMHHAPNGKPLGTSSPKPNLWTVLQQWIDAVPETTDKDKARKKLLQHELDRSYNELGNSNGIGEHGLVVGHCDLLSGNVIVLPTTNAKSKPSSVDSVTFIDYEYATPCPAAYDISNHFAEWAGFNLDYSRIPSRSTRRAFIKEYLSSYNKYVNIKIDENEAGEALFLEVERFKGMPGFYWGIWSLIQAKISSIDFDYAQYAEDRLSEYWAWRAEKDSTIAPQSKAIQLRERRWNSD